MEADKQITFHHVHGRNILKIYAKLQIKFWNEFGTKRKLQDFKIVYQK